MGERIFNFLTLIMLLLTGVAIVVMALIAINPYTPLNPFPPEPLPTLMPTPTSRALPTPRPTDTPTLTPSPTLPPTWTPTPSPTPTEGPTETPMPTETPTPRPQATWTPTPITPTPTKTPTPSPTPMPFTYNIIYNVPYYGCSWTGVSGIVVDMNGNHLNGYPIRITGGGLNEVVYSGSASLYGASGWEYAFSTTELIRSMGEFSVQLYDKANPKAPISGKIVLNFPGNNCTQAMAFVTFTKLP